MGACAFAGSGKTRSAIISSIVDLLPRRSADLQASGQSALNWRPIQARAAISNRDGHRYERIDGLIHDMTSAADREFETRSRPQYDLTKPIGARTRVDPRLLTVSRRLTTF
jgi:hypothetical protein